MAVTRARRVHLDSLKLQVTFLIESSLLYSTLAAPGPQVKHDVSSKYAFSLFSFKPTIALPFSSLDNVKTPTILSNSFLLFDLRQFHQLR